MNLTLLYGGHLTTGERAVIRHMLERSIWAGRSGRTDFRIHREEPDSAWGENAFGVTISRNESNTRGELFRRDRRYVVRANGLEALAS